jgi:hypothetical protein
MKPLFVTSLSEYSGKNLILLGLGKRLIEEGYKIGMFKPLGIFPTRVGNVLTDEDTIFFRKVFNLSDPLEDMCPCVITDSLIEDVLEGEVKDCAEQIKSSYKRIAKGKDVVLVESLGDLSYGSFVGAPFEDLVNEFGGKVITVDIPRWLNHTMDGFLDARKRLGEAFLGAVFNKVKPSRLEFFNRAVVPYLEKHGVDVLGLIPEDPVLASVSVRELKEALGGEVACCPEKLEELVERYTIGAMNVESALRYMHKIKNKAVIVGGDRADIQLAALETSTACLILTGDLYPNEIILSKATAAGVPIIVVKGDTGSVVERAESLLGHLSIRSESKVSRAVEIVKREIRFDRILKGLGI